MKFFNCMNLISLRCSFNFYYMQCLFPPHFQRGLLCLISLSGGSDITCRNLTSSEACELGNALTAWTGFLLGFLAHFYFSPWSHELTLSVWQITLASLTPVILTLCSVASLCINIDWISILTDLWSDFDLGRCTRHHFSSSLPTQAVICSFSFN